MRLTQRARRPVQKELLAVFEKMMAQRPASGGARRAPEGPYAMEDARPQFDDSLIDGGDAVGYPVPRGEDGRDGGDRPWPRPLPAVPPPSDMEEDPPRRIVRVVNSLFPHKKPTVFFDYPSYVGYYRECDPKEVDVLRGDAPGNPPRFTITSNVHEYNCVKSSFFRAGFIRDDVTDGWCAMWTKHLKEEDYSRMNPYQKLNHFPASWNLGRKDRLCRNIARMRREHGEHYNISSPTYLLPADRAKLMRDMEEEPKSIWILKPPASSCGRGISLISKAAGSVLPKPDKPLIAQRYIKHPFLIDGFKFDLRIYALVTSYDPLKVYLFHNGLVRFCTEKYSLSSKNLKNRFGHLTNYSVNKKNEKFDKNTDPEADGEGSKWSLQALLRWFELNGIDGNKIIANISDVIIKTLMSCESEVSSYCTRVFHQRNLDPTAGSACFELFGFDILLDRDLRAWLIEVNICPSLSSSSPMDRNIKHTLMCDIFHMVGFMPYDPDTVEAGMMQSKVDRMLSKSREKATGSTHRNVKQLAALNAEDLNLWELSVLCDFEDEEHRRGHFTRIFPTPETRYYNQFFESHKVNNFLLDVWIHKWKAVYGVPGLRALVLRQMDALRNPKAPLGPMGQLPPDSSRKPTRSRSASRPKRAASAKHASSAVKGARDAVFGSDTDSAYSVDGRSPYDSDGSDKFIRRGPSSSGGAAKLRPTSAGVSRPDTKRAPVVDDVASDADTVTDDSASDVLDEPPKPSTHASKQADFKSKLKGNLSEVLGAWEGILTPPEDKFVPEPQPRKMYISRRREVSSTSASSFDGRPATAVPVRMRPEPSPHKVSASLEFGTKSLDDRGQPLVGRRPVHDVIPVSRRSTSTHRRTGMV